MKAVLELQNVSKTYKLDSVSVEALNKVDLKVMKEDFISIMGPSGSGKSTMLHIMGVLDRPTSGKVYLDGVDTSRLSDDRLAVIRGEKIGFVFQTFNLYPTLTASENVELPMTIVGVEKREREKRALKLLEQVGLAHRASHLPTQLSGGERQRVSIARALANSPAFLLADEPTGNLDTKTGNEIMELLLQMNKEFKVTVIVVTHDEVIAKHAKRTIRVRDGKLVG